MAHAQKPDYVFPWNGRVHLNLWGHQFSRLLAAEVCASAVVMLDKPRSEGVWEYWLPTPFASFPFIFPSVRHCVPPGSERALRPFTKISRTIHGGKVTILRNQQVQTDRTIPNKTPDIIIHYNKQGTCILIDVAIPAIKKEAEKIFIYKNLIIEIRFMWNVKAKVIPVITGAIGTISKSIRQYLSNIPGKHEIKELQKQPYWALHTYYRKC